MGKDRKHFRELTDSMLIPVLDFDLDLFVEYANVKALELFGMDETDIRKGVHLDTLVAKEQIELVHRGLKGLQNGAKPTSLSLRVVRKDNVHVPTQVYSDRIMSDGKLSGFVAYLVDLSRRVAVEEKIRERIDLLEYIVEYSSFNGIMIIDDKYRFEYVNDKLCDIVGVGRGDLLGSDFRQYVHPDSLDLVAERYEKRQRGVKLPSTYEFRIRRADGTPRDVRVHVSTMTGRDGKVKSVTQLMDITDQKVHERMLEESERNYRQLVETMTAGMGVDDENGIIIYTNAALNEMLGYEKGELVGTENRAMIYGLTEEKERERKAARRKGEVEHYEAKLIHKSGELIPVMVSAAPIRDPDGKHMGSFAIFTEVSDLKSTEDEVRFLLDLLMHDVGNQMQVIIAGAGFLQEECTTDEVKRAKRYILDGADRCLDLITKVRKAEASKLDPVAPMNLIPVLRKEVELLSKQYGVTPRMSGVPERVRVMADNALSQLLWNLLENGVKHNSKPERRLWILGKRKSKTFSLSISDDGPGLTASKKKAILNAERRYGGVGFHLVRRLADKYDAEIRVTDRVKGRPRQGLEVTVEFRLSDPSRA
ncbi:MAG: PAS domain S-box protein [Candidatus Thorarchaeota archaeon]|jgi:PAS domain S-box-containing protein